MKVYIAGKITGDPGYHYHFHKVEAELYKRGDIPINPAALPEGMAPADYMRICFAMIDAERKRQRGRAARKGVLRVHREGDRRCLN